MSTRPSPPDDLHEWISFDDPDEERTWVFDITFLASGWRCIFGQGCPGIHPDGPAPEKVVGCCDHGAYFSDDADLADTMAAVERLTPEQWQHHRVGHRKGWWITLRDGNRKTRVVDGACIFHNRPGFAGGTGCALHHAAVAAGDDITVWKPDVCWQAPIRQHDSADEYGRVTSMVREWKRRDWGSAGDDFCFWCTDAPDAFDTRPDAVPVYLHSRAELVALCGETVYGMLADELDRRRAGGVVFLPHPALRRPSWTETWGATEGA